MPAATEFPFVPGFSAALERAPDAQEARERLAAMASAGTLSRRSRAMIALTVTQQGGVDYCIWAQTCIARDAGLTGEDIAFACAGTALGSRDAAMTWLARAIALEARFSEEDINRMPEYPPLTRREMREVAACAGATLIENCLLMSIAPYDARTADAGRIDDRSR